MRHFTFLANFYHFLWSLPLVLVWTSWISLRIHRTNSLWKSYNPSFHLSSLLSVNFLMSLCRIWWFVRLRHEKNSPFLSNNPKLKKKNSATKKLCTNHTEFLHELPQVEESHFATEGTNHLWFTVLLVRLLLPMLLLWLGFWFGEQ